jgi:diacylglycerol kinase (ATP)
LKNTLIIVNPNAAQGQAARMVPWLLERLHTSAGAPDLLLVAQSTQHCTEHIRKLPMQSRIVVCGGDGTIHQLLRDITAGQHSLGLIQNGTGNDCARAWGLHSFDSAAAMWQTAIGPATRTVDLGQTSLSVANEAPGNILFASSLCCGLDAATTRSASTLPRWLRGSARYTLAAARELLRTRLWPVRVSLDGQVIYNGGSLICSALNTPTYGGGMPAAPLADPTDGRINLLLAKQFSRLTAAPMLPRILLGLHAKHPQVQLAPFQTLHIQATQQPLPIALDGEVYPDATSIQVSCLPQALSVAVPERNCY